MRGLTLKYLARRIFVFILTVWLASTAIFIIPRLAPGDPVEAMVSRMSQVGGFVENSEKIIEGWRERFGLNDPISIQYFRYIGNLATFDFGISLANFPSPVSEIIAMSLPWSYWINVYQFNYLFLHRQSIWCSTRLEKNTFDS